MLTLNQFPEAIAQSALALLNKEKIVRQIQASIDDLYGSIDAAIAFDNDLKNDAQRKAKRTEMIGEFHYLAEMGKLLEIRRRELKEAQIHHELLLNQWQAAKLLCRERIATLETGSL